MALLRVDKEQIQDGRLADGTWRTFTSWGPHKCGIAQWGQQYGQRVMEKAQARAMKTFQVLLLASGRAGLSGSDAGYANAKANTYYAHGALRI